LRLIEQCATIEFYLAIFILFFFNLSKQIAAGMEFVRLHTRILSVESVENVESASVG